MSTIESDAVTAATGVNTPLVLTGKGTGKVSLGDASLLVPDADGAAGQIVTTDGSANLAFAATPGTSGNVLTSNGSAWTSAAAATLPVAGGGTGAVTHTANNVLVGNGTSAIASVAPSTSGNVLTSNGSAWTSAAAGGGGKVLQVVNVPLASNVAFGPSQTPVTILSASITISSGSSILALVATTVYGYSSTYNSWDGAADHIMEFDSVTEDTWYNQGSKYSDDASHTPFVQKYFTGKSAGAHTITMKTASMGGTYAAQAGNTSITLFEIGS